MLETVKYITYKSKYSATNQNKTKYELFSLKESRLASGKTGFEHANFPVSTKADEVDVIITWQEHPFRSMRNGQKVESRKFKEHFVLKMKKQMKCE